MSITLDTPEQRPSATTVRLVSFTANTILKYAEAIYEVGFGTPVSFTPTRTVKMAFSNSDPDAAFTFTQLVQAVPEVRDLQSAMEQKAIDLGVFDGVMT